MCSKLRIVLLFGMCFLASHLRAQESLYQRFTVADGLPSNHINCVNLDSSGHIWVGTTRGAARFDGYEWKVWDQDAGLPQNEILKIRHHQKMEMQNLLC